MEIMFILRQNIYTRLADSSLLKIYSFDGLTKGFFFPNAMISNGISAKCGRSARVIGLKWTHLAL